MLKGLTLNLILNFFQVAHAYPQILVLLVPISIPLNTISGQIL